MISTVQLILFFGDASAIFQNYSIYICFHSENVKTITDQGREKDLVEKNWSQSSRIGRRATRYISECDCRLRRWLRAAPTSTMPFISDRECYRLLLCFCVVCVCVRAREKKKRRRDLLCVYVVHVCFFVFFSSGQMMLFHISEMTSSSNKTTCHILNVIIGWYVVF